MQTQIQNSDSQQQINFNQPFEGSDFNPVFDQKRLSTQLLEIFSLMQDKTFRTLSEIEKITGHGQSSISAQLRNLRKQKFGSHTLNKKRRGQGSQGLFEYQIISSSI
jgi:predicted transcriptional regulator